MQVHHINGVDWEQLIDLVYERLLVSPDELECLCVDCHTDTHKNTPDTA